MIKNPTFEVTRFSSGHRAVSGQGVITRFYSHTRSHATYELVQQVRAMCWDNSNPSAVGARKIHDQAQEFEKAPVGEINPHMDTITLDFMGDYVEFKRLLYP